MTDRRRKSLTKTRIRTKRRGELLLSRRRSNSSQNRKSRSLSKRMKKRRTTEESKRLRLRNSQRASKLTLMTGKTMTLWTRHSMQCQLRTHRQQLQLWRHHPVKRRR